MRNIFIRTGIGLLAFLILGSCSSSEPVTQPTSSTNKSYPLVDYYTFY